MRLRGLSQHQNSTPALAFESTDSEEEIKVRDTPHSCDVCSQAQFGDTLLFGPQFRCGAIRPSTDDDGALNWAVIVWWGAPPGRLTLGTVWPSSRAAAEFSSLVSHSVCGYLLTGFSVHSNRTPQYFWCC